jgi:hypothetical protein
VGSYGVLGLHEAQAMTPPPDRIRLGDVWLDLQGRRHRADPCVVAGLVLMEPLDDVLVPVAMSAASPHPWRRVSWGGEP